jgi:riboflavin synthase
MFSGLIEACVPAHELERRGAGARLFVPVPAGEFGPPELREPWRVAAGDSVAICGCCLTVVEEPKDGVMAFDLSAETLARTWLGEVAPGRTLNLERSVRLMDRLGGHLVAGHVDGPGKLVASVDSGDGGRVMTFEVEPRLERYLFDKGSVSLDGISLTVVEPRPAQGDAGPRFDVAVIPLTLEKTNLGDMRLGQPVNVEADLIGRWVERLLPGAASA